MIMKNNKTDQAFKGTAKGDHAVKEHLSNGSKTRCKRNAIHKNDYKEFAFIAEKYPEICCQICLNFYKMNHK